MFNTVSVRSTLDSRSLDTSFKVKVDQFDSKDFNLNDAGWIRNDLSQLARATSKSQFDSFMARLVQLKDQGSLPDGVTAEQAISMIKPRYVQSPNEIEQFIEWTNGDVMQRVDNAYREALSKKGVSLSSEPDSSGPVSSESGSDKS